MNWGLFWLMWATENGDINKRVKKLFPEEHREKNKRTNLEKVANKLRQTK